MSFRTQDHSGITTVDQLQEAMLDAGLDGYGYIIWDHQRAMYPPSGTYVVTPAAQGYRVTHEERSSVVEVGIYPDQASVARKVLSLIDPQPRQTPEERARAAASGRRATIENAAHRDELRREAAEMLAEHRRAVSAQRAGSAESPS